MDQTAGVKATQAMLTGKLRKNIHVTLLYVSAQTDGVLWVCVLCVQIFLHCTRILWAEPDER